MFLFMFIETKVVIHISHMPLLSKKFLVTIHTQPSKNPSISDLPTSQPSVNPSMSAHPSFQPSALNSFYSCSTNSSPTDDIEVTLTYDYELHTTSPLNDAVLSSFQNSITYDMARQHGLIDCNDINNGSSNADEEDQTVTLFRALQLTEILALGSDPVDESLASSCKLPFLPFSIFRNLS